MAQFKCENCGAKNEIKKSKEFGITQKTARFIYILIFVPFLIYTVSQSPNQEVNIGLSLIIITSMLYNARNLVK